MKHLLFYQSLVFLIFLLIANLTSQTYDLAFSTFFGGSDGEGIRDIEADSSDNIFATLS